MLTKKYYALIALAISRVPWELGPTDQVGRREEIIESLSAILALDNPRFDRSKFADACKGIWRKRCKACGNVS